MIRKLLLAVLIVISCLILGLVYYSSVVRRVKLSDKIPLIDSKREAKALSAFFGLDELPLSSLMLYWKAHGKNGMPVVFSQEVDPRTLDEEDFEVISRNGTSYSVEFVTLKPAEEEFELRTVLLIGEYGNYPDNPPVTVRIKGDLMSRSGQNYKEQFLEVIPLPDGPTLSYSEYFKIDNDYPYVKSGRGCDCPKDDTDLVIRTVWSGGVRAINGEELGDNELDAFTISLVKDKDTIQVKPFKLADLGDNDNNIDLCLKANGVPILVDVKANVAIDPRDDPNPRTQIGIISRW